MYPKRNPEQIRADIEQLEKEIGTKEPELERLQERLDGLYSELRHNLAEAKSETVKVTATYGGRLPVRRED